MTNKKIIIIAISMLLVILIYPSVSLSKGDYKEEYQKAINHYYELLDTARVYGYDTTAAEELKEQANVSVNEGYYRVALMLIEQANKMLEEKLKGQPDFVLPTQEPTQISAPTKKPAATPTQTIKSTATPTQTIKPTDTPTQTIKPTDTPTQTIKPTDTPTQTIKPTDTPTQTIKPTDTPTQTIKPTDAPTQTIKPTDTPTQTIKPTDTPTQTIKPTDTPTQTIKPTDTPTQTIKPTDTPTQTIKPTDTPGPAITGSPAVTAKPTETPIPEDSNQISYSFDRNEGFLFGLNTVHQPIFNELLPYYKKTSAKWIVIDDLIWAKRKPPVWSKMDEKVTSLYNNGFSVIFEINLEPKEKGGSAEFPSDPEEYSKFIFYSAARYDGTGDYRKDGIIVGPPLPKVNYWKILNEPNLNRYWQDTPANYAKLIRLSAENIHKANPDAKIIFGGISNKDVLLGEKVNTSFLENLFKFTFPDGKKVQDYLDYMDFHYQGNSKGLDEFLQTQMDIMKKYNIKKPFIMTEIGCPGGVKFSFEDGHFLGASLNNQATEMIKMFIIALSRGAEKICYLSISDQKKQLKDTSSSNTIFVSDEEPEDIYQYNILSYNGLYYFDFAPKPAMTCYKIIAEKLRNMRISHELLGLAEGVRCFVLVKNKDSPPSTDDAIYVLWNDKDKEQNVSINLPWKKAKMTSFVLAQKEEIYTSDLESKNGTFEIHLTELPVMLEFSP